MHAAVGYAPQLGSPVVLCTSSARLFKAPTQPACACAGATHVSRYLSCKCLLQQGEALLPGSAQQSWLAVRCLPAQPVAAWTPSDGLSLPVSCPVPHVAALVLWRHGSLGRIGLGL